MQRARYQLCDAETGRIVVPRLEVADTLWRQTVGLIGRDALTPDFGMWLQPCNGIHTLGMRFAIDVVFFDRTGTAIKSAAEVRPYRICGPLMKAHSVLELPAGALARSELAIGRGYAVRSRRR